MSNTRENNNGPDRNTYHEGGGYTNEYGKYSGNTFLTTSLRLVTRRASETNIRMQQWAIPDYLAKGSLTALAGPKASGKSTIYSTMAAAITRGGLQLSWPGLLNKNSGSVLIISSEDDWDKTIVPRLLAANADLSRIAHIDGKEYLGNNIVPYSFDSKDDERLIQSTKDLGGVSLVVIDPWTLVIKGDANNGIKVQRTLERLSQLAKTLDAAILLIAHVVKGAKGRDPIARFAGNAAVTRVPRGLLIVSKIDDEAINDTGTHVLVRVATNIGATGGGWSYHIEGADVPSDEGVVSVSKIVWDTELFGAPEEILAEAENTDNAKKTGAIQKATDFLMDALGKGPCPFPVLLEKAKEKGISGQSLIRVKKISDIKHKKHKEPGQAAYSLWFLPSVDLVKKTDDPIENYDI